VVVEEVVRDRYPNLIRFFINYLLLTRVSRGVFVSIRMSKFFEVIPTDVRKAHDIADEFSL